MSARDIRHFTPGDRVEGLDPGSHRWRPAVILSDAPYPRAKTGGAYVRWSDLAGVQWESAGGWLSQNCIRVPA